MDDPWDWDVDRVVQEFCTVNRSWRPSLPLKLPPLNQLEEALREHDVNGELLLTYDPTELCAGLGIKSMRHRSTVKQAIQGFQKRSKRHRSYRKRLASESEDDGEETGNELQLHDGAQDEGTLEAQAQAPMLNTSSEIAHSKALTHQPAPLTDDLSQINNERISKKRKVAPTTLTSEIDPHRNRNIATEADMVRLPSKPVVGRVEEEPVSNVSLTVFDGAYLGGKSITRFDIIDFGYPGSIGHLEPLTEEGKQMNIVSMASLYPGRTIQTHRLMKRRLLGGIAPKRTGFIKSDIVPGLNNPGHDEVLPLYGDSDDEMEYDSDTWREIEAEKAEKDLKQSLPKGLTADEINSTFDRVTEQMVAEWKTTKLPKYASKAHLVWSEARMFGLKEAIDRARRDHRDLEARIAKWKGTIQMNEYRNVKELEHSLSSFEPSIFDREHRSWLIGVLTSPTQPAKMGRPRQPAARSSKPRPTLADDEEVLTSESEDDLGDFIVDDELENPIVTDDGYLSVAEEEDHVEHDEQPDTDMGLAECGDIAETDAGPFGRDTGPSKMDLQTPTKPTQPIVIDLTTPDHTRRIISYKSGKPSTGETPSRIRRAVAHYPLIMGITDLTSAEQRVASELSTLDQIFINAIFSVTWHYQPVHIWSGHVLPALDRAWPEAPYNDHIRKDGLTAYTFVRLFETYKDDTPHKFRQYKNLDEEGKRRLREIHTLWPGEWDAFIKFLKRLSDRFEWNETEKRIVSSAPTPDVGNEKMSGTDSSLDDMDVDADVDGYTEENVLQSSQRKKRKKRREVIRNREAAMARELDQAGAAERETRRKLLRERLVTEGSTALGSQQGGIIVNESKKDDQGFIYINDEIAHRIKEHQVTGVRFMWDQLVVAEKRQGCLLAHTMGLGKTMQIITLLVTIGQASRSSDPSISSQIPEEMRDSRTLILCPATLVNNWADEMYSWLPSDNELGGLYKVDAVMSVEQRDSAVRTWGALGGIMIIGYNLFKSFVEDAKMGKILLERPNIVIADEAHMMKNANAQTHMATAHFRTLSRVALTGSPLANNVVEYFAMINWVAPNYLGDIREFRAQYANPIKEGLHADSTESERRRALRMLRVLKSEVSPKVSRITIAVLKHDIPVKKEFVIIVPLTDIQRQAYEMFIQYHSNADPNSSKVPVFAIHDLTLICASPSIFLEKLKAAKKDTNNSAGQAEKATLPQQLISNEMALLRNAERKAKDDFTLSWKVPILLEILDQCKKLGEYVLLFSHSTVALDYLEGILRMKKLSFVRLDGKTHMEDRQSLVKRFNQGNIDIFLISTKAGALGLNITGANRVVIFDAKFNPQDEQQAVGRAYRIGQKKPVFVYRFVCGGTCEQKLLHQAIWKMQLASRVVDKKHPIHKARRFAGAWAMPEEPEQKDLKPMLGKDTVLDALLNNPKYKEGIRAIEMMDTFEEESVEDAELLPEDLAFADQKIRENEARRSGKPLPAHLPDGTPVPGGHDHNHAPPDQPVFAGTPNRSHPLEQLPLTEPSGPSQPLPQPSSTGPPSGDPNSQSLPPAIRTGWANGAFVIEPSLSVTQTRYRAPVTSDDGHDSRLPSSMLPMQLPGAEVHIRPSGDHSNGAPVVIDAVWDSLSEIQGELNRAFTVYSRFPDQETRSRVSADVSSVIWDHLQHKSPQQRLATKLAITRAISAERFVEALCMGTISPQQLGRMTPESIDQELKALKETDGSEWEAKKNVWRAQSRSGDPEHLQTALDRLSAAPNRDGNDAQTDQNKSHRLDDQEALRAVFERRKLKTQQKDDQAALQAVHERRKAKDLPSQSSDTNNQSKEPRLPVWARNAVRQAQTTAPSSSALPRTPSSPKFSLQTEPKTPFK